MTGKLNISKKPYKPVCSHVNITFLGVQQTNVMNKFLYLYNCDYCGTTIPFKDKKINLKSKL